jgi:hypothetical protein
MVWINVIQVLVSQLQGNQKRNGIGRDSQPGLSEGRSMGKVVLVIDAQGGGLGRQLINLIRKEVPDVRIIAVGTNYAATAAMLKAGADEAATGENSVVVACRKADVIVGPVGMVIADSMLGEITPRMSHAIARASAMRVMIPFNDCDNYIAGISDYNMGKLLLDAVRKVRSVLTQEG